jgi:hypothetical protein
MKGLNATDAQLLQIVTAASPATITDVLAVMQEIDNLLPSNDGLKWFNLLYLKVTEKVDTQPPPNGWEDEAWLTLLDVVFAKFYFAAISGPFTSRRMRQVPGLHYSRREIVRTLIASSSHWLE